MFSGIGGFRAGLSLTEGFQCVGHCEIDKHADRSYRAIHNIDEKEVFYDDARSIDPDGLPDFDLLCAGFPCQPFSSAGKRQGFSDARGTLFLEVARLAGAKRPSYLLLENVPGLLSHDGGRTYSAILATLVELGYRVEWQVFNSANFGVPQSRKRVFIVGYLDRRCAGKILPVFGTNAKALVQLRKGRIGTRVYDSDGLSCTLKSAIGGFAGNTGLYFVDMCKGKPTITSNARCLTAKYDGGLQNRKAEKPGVLFIKEATKSGYKEAQAGDCVDLSYAGNNTRRGRVGRGIAHTLDTGSTKGVVMRNGKIRRLMPRECLRLQGFTDEQADKILAITSDAQVYRQAGNSVTVNVIFAIGKRILEADDALKAGDLG